jgi:hypothetical protein
MESSIASRKPDFLAVTLYVPAATAENEKAPAASVVVSVGLASSLLRRTETPIIGFPAESRIMPSTSATGDCGVS